VIRGAEGQVSARRAASTASLVVTWLDPRNRTPGSAEDGNRLPRRARLSGRLELGHQWANVHFAARLNAVGPRFEDLANTQRLGGYTTLDLLSSFAPAQQWSVEAKLANVSARHYETAEFYPQDGRTGWISLRYHPSR
jgi:vitamin B12 transporter